jgi:hypothetical protein
VHEVSLKNKVFVIMTQGDSMKFPPYQDKSVAGHRGSSLDLVR